MKINLALVWAILAAFAIFGVAAADVMLVGLTPGEYAYTCGDGVTGTMTVDESGIGVIPGCPAGCIEPIIPPTVTLLGIPSGLWHFDCADGAYSGNVTVGIDSTLVIPHACDEGIVTPVDVDGVKPGCAISWEQHSSLPPSGLEGFGTETEGGASGAPFAITTLADDGPGSLRDALSGSNRHVTFAISGTIEVTRGIALTGHHITLDGAGQSITIRPANSFGGAVLNLNGAHDVIIRNIRVSDATDSAAGDNLRIWNNAYRIVIDHCSFRRPGDGNLDISDGSREITVQWCILAEAVKNSLIRTNVANVSLHHNLYFGDERNPQVKEECSVIDMVNCVVYSWASNYGTRFRQQSSGNIRLNYYKAGPGSDLSNAIQLLSDVGGVWIESNVTPAGSPAATGPRLPAPAVTELDPVVAYEAVLSTAGAWPRDADDAGYVAQVRAGR